MSYSCDQCNKNYKTYQSIWNHNKKFHNNQNIQTYIKNSEFKKIMETVIMELNESEYNINDKINKYLP